MIDIAVGHIATSLNQHLKKLFHLSENIVLISNLGELHRRTNADNQNKLVISLLNIEEDTAPTRASQSRQASTLRTGSQIPAMCLNLSVLIAADFQPTKYQESLKFIAYTIGFFQNNPVFTPQNSPPFKGTIEQLNMEISSLDMQELNALWGMLGCPCMPSVMYKARMLAYDETHTANYLSL